MPRDLKKEAARAKAKYQRFNFAIDKILGDKFIKYLKENGINQTDWFRTEIEKTLQEPDPVLTQTEIVLSQALDILSHVKNQTLTQDFTQELPIHAQDFTQVTDAPQPLPEKKADKRTNSRRSAPVLNPFTNYKEHGLEGLRESLSNLTASQLYDIICGHEFNRHHSKDSTTKAGKPKRFNVFDIQNTSSLIQYILDVVPVAALEDKYQKWL